MPAQYVKKVSRKKKKGDLHPFSCAGEERGGEEKPSSSSKREEVGISFRRKKKRDAFWFPAPEGREKKKSNLSPYFLPHKSEEGKKRTRE